MSEPASGNTRIIQINNGVIGPNPPKRISLKSKKKGAFPQISDVYLEVAKNYSSKVLAGPPICDELVALVQHMYTEEEASIVRHLKPFRIKSAKSISKAEHSPLERVKNILDHLSREKGLLWCFGHGSLKRYHIIPLIPGTFESALMGTPTDKLTDWQQTFAKLFEELYDEGYGGYYAQNAPPIIRTFPVSQTIESYPVALPTDKLEEIIDRYDSFGVGLCSCRTASKINMNSCDKPLEVCTGIGLFADILIKKGMLRRAEKQEIFDIKKEAEKNGLVNWTFNVDEKYGKFGNFSCSCCGCCCAVFRTITDFNMPGVIAPPHFMPVFDLNQCLHCGECAKRCQLGAITIDTFKKTSSHNPKRCIGCGQCVIACRNVHAIKMEPANNYKKPPTSWPMMGVSLFPDITRLGWGLIKKAKQKQTQLP